MEKGGKEGVDYVKEYGACSILSSKELDIAEKVLKLIKNELPEEARSYVVVKGIINASVELLNDKTVNL